MFTASKEPIESQWTRIKIFRYDSRSEPSIIENDINNWLMTRKRAREEILHITQVIEGCYLVTSIFYRAFPNNNSIVQ